MKIRSEPDLSFLVYRTPLGAIIWIFAYPRSSLASKMMATDNQHRADMSDTVLKKEYDC